MIIPLVFMPGQWEILLIVGAILLLFGGRKIPEMMRGLGTGIKEFKQGVREDEDPKSVSDGDSSKEKKKDS